MTRPSPTGLYCCGCQKDVPARLTDGREVYPHRPDLFGLTFWKCDTCGNYVGCHHKTKDRTRPLGNIPTKELKNARQHIHRILDPIWQKGKVPRGKLYAKIAEELGIAEYHTAEIKTVEDARKVYAIVKRLAA
ncbi:zinc-finger-containing protein [Zavarzinella formosa]|uniref:zinc-finger-containing protein n=1 Tax=Zavarzinella formosa TaxID=360055 RepID=UPI0002D91DD5|nr:zinc-finger-containing protein [Zavarzinella formosa]